MKIMIMKYILCKNKSFQYNPFIPCCPEFCPQITGEVKPEVPYA